MTKKVNEMEGEIDRTDGERDREREREGEERERDRERGKEKERERERERERREGHIRDNEEGTLSSLPRQGVCTCIWCWCQTVIYKVLGNFLHVFFDTATKITIEKRGSRETKRKNSETIAATCGTSPLPTHL